MGHPTDIFIELSSNNCICAICHDVLEDASSLKECGHTFCDACIRDLESHSSPCPNCRAVVRGANANYILRDVIESMQVRCPDAEDGNSNKRKRDENDREETANSGCNWKGQLKDLKDHESVCGYKIVPCTVDGCTHTCRRRDIESHLSSGTGMMMHMDLKLSAMEQRHKTDMRLMELEMERKYESKIQQLRYDIRELTYKAEDAEYNVKDAERKCKDMRMEANHTRYLNDCSNWIEYVRVNGDKPWVSDISVYAVRKLEDAVRRKGPISHNHPITGLLCTLYCGGSTYPLMVRHKSAMEPPCCTFPHDFFHLNVCPGGYLRSQDFGWTCSTSMSTILLSIMRLLYYPNESIHRNTQASILFLDIDGAEEDHIEGTGSSIPVHYKNRVQEEALKYAGRSVYPKVIEMLKYGELIDEDSVLGPTADTFLSSCYQKQNTYVPNEVNPNWRDQS